MNPSAQEEITNSALPQSNHTETMRKRYSNIAAAALAAHEMAREVREKDGRKSFALDMAKIPSYGRLNGDALFAEEKQRDLQRHRSSKGSRRRRRSSEGRRKEMRRSFSLQIPETKVVIEPVTSFEDALFQDETACPSVHTATTANSSSHSRTDQDHTESSFADCDDLEDFFSGIQQEESTSLRYKSLGTRVQERSSKKGPPRTPADLKPMRRRSSVQYRDGENSTTRTRTRTVQSARAGRTIPLSSHNRTPRSVSGHSRATTLRTGSSHNRTVSASPSTPRSTTTRGSFSGHNRGASTATPRSTRRSFSMNRESPMHHRRRVSLGEADLTVPLTPSTTRKSDDKPLGGLYTPQTNWSLKSLVASQHRRSSHRQQLYQELFGEDQ